MVEVKEGDEIVHGEKTEKAAADGTITLKGIRVKQGEIFILKYVAATGNNSGAGESVAVGYFDGRRNKFLKETDETGRTDYWLIWTGEVILIEGQYPVAYFEAANTGELLELHYYGIKRKA